MTVSKRSMISIDGFNLFYGAGRNTAWKWLNLEKYFTLIRPDDDVQRIHAEWSSHRASSAARRRASLSSRSGRQSASSSSPADPDHRQ